MAKTSILVDASFLVAPGNPRDANYIVAVRSSDQVRKTSQLLLSDVALVEAVYNLRRPGGLAATIRFTRRLANSKAPFIALTPDDFLRAVELMDKYVDAELDFVDCCLTALAERLKITQICTFDRRDFSMTRPAHVDYSELLP